MPMAPSSTTHNVLLVPMHLDALCLQEAKNVREALADFGKMPFKYKVGSDYHVHNNRANISEHVLSQAFSPSFLELKAGIHLHWALPDTLTRSVQSDPEGRHRFPVVPNRWLVTRARNGAVDKEWVVESDFLYPDLSGVPSIYGPTPSAAVVPFPHADVRKGPYQPFRHMGRAMPLADWPSADPAEHLRQHDLALTAMGPVEWVASLDHVRASFAAYYPGCFSVFGFHDPDAALGENPSGVRYDVIGWYDQPASDILNGWYNQRHGDADRWQMLEDWKRRFRWQVDLGDKELPARTVCYARLAFNAGARSSRANPAATEKEATLAVGSTGTEALAAYLAHAIDPENKILIEQQLDALEFTEQLEQRQLDLGARFQEARHERGFTGQSGGLLWSIQRAESAGANGEEELTLPGDLAHTLSALNQLQAEYDRARDATASMSSRLFNDWHKWMFCTHPEGLSEHHTGPRPDDAPPPATDLSTAYNVIVKSDLNPLRKHICTTGKLGWRQHRMTREVTGLPDTLRFGIVAAYQSYYFTRYRDRLDDGNVTDGYWGEELKSLGLTVSANAGAEVVHEGDAEGEGREWRIVNGEQTYRVKVEGGVMNLYIPPFEEQLAVRLKRAIDDLQRRVFSVTPVCVLKAVPSPRYWQPNDPVVLMVGDSLKPSDRHGRDGRLRTDGQLACQLLEGVDDEKLNSLPSHADLLDKIRQAVDVQSFAAESEPRIGLTGWTQQPWNPFLLEWGVQLFPHPVPMKEGVETYNAEFITGRYTLEPEAVDLKRRAATDDDFVDNAEPYQGLSILSPHASGLLRQRIASYVIKQRLLLPKEHSDALYGRTLEDAERYLDANAQAILAAYTPPEGDTEAWDDTLHTALVAFVKLQGLPTLSQALNGFNDALLMQKRTLQLDIHEPLGGDKDQLLAIQVAGTVRDSLLLASTPIRDWNPVRAGELRITQLRLVDSFGQINDLKTPSQGATMVSAELMPLRVSGLGDHRVVLTPRLAQPARILFRWLSAAPLQGEGEGGIDDQPEMNDHPATTPICGWIVPNNLDRSLMVYDAAGLPLGVVNTVGFWDPAPGAALPVGVEAIPNAHLRKVVTHLTSTGRAGHGYTKAFGAALNSALDQSDPETFAHSKALSLLIGRPLAVVRATVDLELKGLPSRDKHWRVFKDTIAEYRASADNDDDPVVVTPITESPERWTRGFDKVKLPIRIGEFRQLNDGLLGYWKENADGSFEGSTFYAPQSEHEGFAGTDDDPRAIVTEKPGQPVHIVQTVDAGPQVLTMLVDPRGVVHATSSVVPAKSISIPPEQYAKALQAIEVTFVSAPLLTGRASYGKAGEERELRVPVPTQPGFTWSWLSRQNGAWAETHRFAAVDATARLSGPQQLCEGWLKLTRETSQGSTEDNGK